MAIVDALIIDGNGGEPIKDGVIIMKDGSIEAVGAELGIPEGAQVIDVDGKVVMPGLADMHIHLATGWDEHGSNTLGVRQDLKAILNAGVTTTLDVGNILPFVAQVSQELDAGRLSGPRLLYVGPLIDDADPIWPDLSHALVSRSQTRGLVNWLKGAGVSGIKAYGRLSSPMIRSLTYVANENDLPVFIDGLARNGAPHMLNAGARAFAHPPRDLTPETIELSLEHDVYFISTLSGYDAAVRARDTAWLEHPLVAETTNPAILAEMRERASAPTSEELTEELSFRSEFRDKMASHVYQLHAAGVPIVAGTDGPTLGLFVGEGIHRELELLVNAGLTPLEAISTATRNAAAMMKADDWGVIEAGRRADVLIIDGRPDIEISDTRNIVTVIQKGEIVDREALKVSQATEFHSDYVIPN